MTPRIAVILPFAIVLAACETQQSAVKPEAQAPIETAAPLVPFAQRVPGTTVDLEMKPVPAGSVDVDGKRVDVAPFWIASTETTWDMYDAFVFALDRAEDARDPPDAWTRPSKPYILMDRGFGHAGYPAISVSYKGATEFCKWLSRKSGKTFRLPTEAEWEHACRGGSKGTFAFGDDAALLPDYAWFSGNSDVEMTLKTHPVAQKKPNALGLFDVHGNAAEWTSAFDGAVARGGSFKDPADKVSATARRPDDKAFNRSDPQVPKSVWWLADGGFIGFRVVCVPDAR